MKKETILLHYGYNNDTTNSAQVPIYQTSSYIFNSTDHAANLFSLNEQGFIYTRIGNPTQAVLEERLAKLHNGSSCLVVSSGQAANSIAIMNIAQNGDNIISSKYIWWHI